MLVPKIMLLNTQSLLGGELSRRRGGHSDRHSRTRLRSTSRSRISSRWDDGDMPNQRRDPPEDQGGNSIALTEDSKVHLHREQMYQEL